MLILVSIFAGFVLDMLWGAFQTIQILLAMPLLAVEMPANVIVVFRGFSDVINLDILDKQTLYNFTFGRFVPNQILESDHSQQRILKSKSTGASEIQNLGYEP